jgi:hypothetical protein
MGDAARWGERAAIEAAELLGAPCCALAALLGARVAAECAGGATHEGLLYSVDPQTRTLVLLEARARARSGAEACR